VSIFKTNRNAPISPFDEALKISKKNGKDLEVANELFAYTTAIFTPTITKKISKKILSLDLSRIETLAIAAEFCKPPVTPDDLCLISQIYVYAGAKYRKQAIQYITQFIPQIDNYSGFPNDLVENADGVIIDQHQANIAIFYDYLGKCYEGEYDFQNALEAFQIGYSRAPYEVSGLLNISRIYMKQNKLDIALEKLRDGEKSEYYKGSYKEVLDRYISEMEDKIRRGYIYRPRKKK
jgi:tetratricopeptide (TPR) repeat protein